MPGRYKIAHLTSVHTPFDTRIFHKECKSLSRAGHDVVLIAQHEREEQIDGVRIRPLPKANSRRERMTRTVWQAYEAAADENADLYQFHDPELTPVGMLLKLRGKPVIYDVHEDLPRQIYNKYWVPKWLQRTVAAGAEVLEAVWPRFFAGVVAATPRIAGRFPQRKTITVQNYPILGELAAPGAVPYCERPAVVAYVGWITALRGAKEMVSAMSLLPAELGARLAMAGTFTPDSLQAEVRALPGSERTDLLGWQDRQQVGDLLGSSRAGLVLFHPAPNHTDAQPNKLFEYMSAGIPVVASDFPQWRQVVEGAGCGLLADPQNPAAIAESMLWMLQHPEEAEQMGKRGQEAVQSRYNWDMEFAKLSGLIDAILTSRSAK